MLIILGISLRIFAGWWDFALMQSGWLLGFLKEKNFPVTKLKLTSRKSVSKRLVSMVIYNLSFLNKALIFFLILSSTGPLLLLIAASLSSLYSPTFSLQIKFDNLSRRYKPTSSQILASSKLPIVKSNNVSSSFLTQVPRLLKSSDFLASFIALMALSSIFVEDYYTQYWKLYHKL